MADEQTQNTENSTTVTPNTENGGDSTVSITQEKLNSLINEKYAKGAEKATNELLSSLGVENVDSLKSIIQSKREQDEANKSDFEKAQETINELQAKLETSTSTLAQMQEANEINSLALEHGIADAEVFKLLYSNAKSTEGFNPDSFIEGLRESKPYVFGQTQATTPKVDNSANKSKPVDFNDRVKAATTRAELDALYKEIGQ